MRLPPKAVRSLRNLRLLWVVLAVLLFGLGEVGLAYLGHWLIGWKSA